MLLLLLLLFLSAVAVDVGVGVGVAVDVGVGVGVDVAVAVAFDVFGTSLSIVIGKVVEPLSSLLVFLLDPFVQITSTFIDQLSTPGCIVLTGDSNRCRSVFTRIRTQDHSLVNGDACHYTT